MKRNINLFIEDIKISIKNIENFTANITEDHFEDDVMIQDAVIRRLEIIGEAAKKFLKILGISILILNGEKLPD